MSRCRKRTGSSTHRTLRKNNISQGFYTPFRDLDQYLVQNSPVTPRFSRNRDPQKAPATPQDEESRVFWEAMADVVPLDPSQRERIPVKSPARKSPRFLAQEEKEVYNHLVDLVNGEAPFELSYSDEYVEGFVVGISPRMLKKLRNGELSYQEYVDLHGHNREQARDVVIRFVQRSFALGHRCILIVSGRGLNSKEKEPVLKRSVVNWLTRAPLKRMVLAFASCRSYDGGVGAFYVVLRRNDGKAPFMDLCP